MLVIEWIMWTAEYILSQVCVILALGLLIGSYYQKNKVWILIFSIGNSIFYSIEFLLLGAYTGAVINAIAIIRGVWFYFLKKNEKNNDYVSISVLSIAMIISGILTFDAWFSIFPIVGTLIYTFSVWQNNVKVYRWLSLPVGLCGVIYNIMCFSVCGIITESALFLFGLISIIAFHVQGQNEKQEIISTEFVELQTNE